MNLNLKILLIFLISCWETTLSMTLRSEAQKATESFINLISNLKTFYNASSIFFITDETRKGIYLFVYLFLTKFISIN